MERGESSLLESRSIYRGRVVDLSVERVELANGETVELEVIHHRGAAAVVPLTAAGDVILVRQYRWATREWLLEVPAGKLDGGEAPERCAARELEEETGWRAERLELLGSIWTTPGFTDERIWLFLAWNLRHVGQTLESDEMITIETMSLDEAVAKALSGEIADGKTICALVRARDFLARSEDFGPGSP